MIYMHNMIYIVMACPLYAEFRNILFQNSGRLIVNFNNVGLDEQFTSIMHKCQKHLAKYIELAYEKRRENYLLYILAQIELYVRVCSTPRLSWACICKCIYFMGRLLSHITC